MYTEFQIKNFKCFEDLKLTDLKRVNLIAGKNNVGKTALLEAVLLNLDLYNPFAMLKHNIFSDNRDSDFDERFKGLSIWEHIFHNYQVAQKVVTEAIVDDISIKVIYSVMNNVTDINGFFKDTRGELIREYRESKKDINFKRLASIILLETLGGINDPNCISKKNILFLDNEGNYSSLTRRNPILNHDIIESSELLKQSIFPYISNLKLDGRDKSLINYLKLVESRISELQILYSANKPMLYCNIGLRKLIPLDCIGDGMKRIINFYNSITTFKNGVVLIDEIENGIHHSALRDMWRIIKETSKENNVQIFATTHSYECIRAAHEVFSETEDYDFKLIRLDNIDGKIKSFSYTKELLESAMDLDFEVR